MNRGFASRVARLEARHRKDAAKVVGIIWSRFGHMIFDPDKSGHLKWGEPPGGFDAWALQQQNTLQAELRTILGNDAPQPKAPTIVGTIANNPAPLKPGQKQPNFVHLADGTEIKIKRN
ncbi:MULTISPECIES: hypothetical protein [Pacificibacter]|uniref:hypothetical protein n=1 Tax=Pacificibacter TaxID=1042323 RepID=UPI001C07FF5C|nr:MULTISPECIES: hypothetical protein [Pacificibacter]MBU2937019.1 hypothetical protein [Pacificibacter marinus]MDO6616520.1 hypothetical protein [Pacificibacter sp. 1_MG-2023]